VVGTSEWRETLETVLKLMAPIFPHISEELWHHLGQTSATERQGRPTKIDSIHVQSWPQGDADKAREDAIEVVVQINGKVRDRLMVAPGTASNTLEQQALALEVIQKWLEGKSVRKVIVVPDKLVNVVIG